MATKVDLPNPEQARQRLLALMTERAFQRKAVTLASGRKSQFYIDSKAVILSAEGHVLVGTLMGEAIARLREQGAPIYGAGGLTLGADPLASAVALVSHLRGQSVEGFIVRKQPKGHGTGAWLEGVGRFPEGAEVVVLEDVVTTGRSALDAVARVREAGFVVRHVLSVVDRLEGGREAIEEEALQLQSLFTRADFMSSEDDLV